MPSRLRASTFAIPLALAAAGGAFAGTANVTVLDPSRYADAGTSSWDERDNLRALTAYIEALGRKLPGDQVLTVELLDLDLAGTVEPSRRDGTPVRIVRNRADFPRMHLRYTLQAGGQTLRTGDEWLSSLDYANRPMTAYQRSQPLAYEKRMLDDWFRTRFAPAATGGR